MQRTIPDIVIMGGAVADVLVRPVVPENLNTGSCPVDSIRLRVGGDAINEATTLARLGHSPLLVTKLGRDSVGDFLENHCAREGIRTVIAREPGVETSINVVLVNENGERSFITAKNTSLRRLTLEDTLPVLEGAQTAQAWRAYKKALDARAKAVSTYEQQVRPLTPDGLLARDGFDWADEPFPWQ